MSPRASRGTQRGLGVLSALLGAPAVAAPAAVAGLAGLAPDGPVTDVLRAVGARELAAAAGLLAVPRRGLVWARVAGDAVDLGLLGVALSGRGLRDRGRAVALTGAVAAITVADVVAAIATGSERHTVEQRASTTLRRPAADVWEAWRDLPRLPTVLSHLDRVEVTGPTTSHWVASAPFGRSVEWDAELVEDQPPERLAWRSVGRTPVPNEGALELRPAPGGRGTELHVELRWQVPAGRLGRVVARWAGEDPSQQLDDDLRRFKQVMETGEVIRSDGAPWGKRARREFPQRPARPLTADELEEVRR